MLRFQTRQPDRRFRPFQLWIDLPHQVQKPCRRPRLHGVGFSGFFPAIFGVLPHGLQQAVPFFLLTVDDQRFVQPAKSANPKLPSLGCRCWRRPIPPHPKSNPPANTDKRQSTAFSCGVSRSYDQSTSARKVCWRGRAVREPPVSSRKRWSRRLLMSSTGQRPHPRRRQFQCQRNAVQPGTHRRHRRRISRRHQK